MHTGRHRATYRAHPWTDRELALVWQPAIRISVLDSVTFDSGLFLTPHYDPGHCRAVYTLRPIQRSTLGGKKDPRWPRRLQQQQASRDRMSRSPEESHSRGGGSDSDLKMASSSNTSPEGGPPPLMHQNRIRQVGVCPHLCIQWPSQHCNEQTEPLLMLRCAGKTLKGVAAWQHIRARELVNKLAANRRKPCVDMILVLVLIRHLWTWCALADVMVYK